MLKQIPSAQRKAVGAFLLAYLTTTKKVVISLGSFVGNLRKAAVMGKFGLLPVLLQSPSTLDATVIQQIVARVNCLSPVQIGQREPLGRTRLSTTVDGGELKAAGRGSSGRAQKSYVLKEQPASCRNGGPGTGASCRNGGPGTGIGTDTDADTGAGAGACGGRRNVPLNNTKKYDYCSSATCQSPMPPCYDHHTRRESQPVFEIGISYTPKAAKENGRGPKPTAHARYASGCNSPRQNTSCSENRQSIKHLGKQDPTTQRQYAKLISRYITNQTRQSKSRTASYGAM